MVDRPVVLVAIDHATLVERTVDAALTIAKRDGLEVHAIEVVRGRAAAYVHERRAPPMVYPRDGTDVRSRLATMAESAARDGVRLRNVTVGGMPEHVIPAYAQLHQARLLVVERDYGSSRFWRNARVVGDLARRSPIPLLVLPPARHTQARAGARLNRILTPIDFSIASAVALRTARDLAHRHGAGLLLVHAMSVPQRTVRSGSEAWRVTEQLPSRARAIVERLRTKAAALGADDVAAQVVTGDPNRAIVATAEKSEADLVVMGVAPRSWLDRLLFGSTLYAVIRRVNVPVLVVPVVAGDHQWLNDPRS